jgi:DMSO reductase anchor subunit
MLMSPSAYHQVVERGEDTTALHVYATRLMMWALLPFAVALGIDLAVAVQKVLGWRSGVAAGFLTFLVAIFFWYGVEFYRRREHAGEVESQEAGGMEKEGNGDGRAKLNDKIVQVLTEARVVLPGAQALIGFQFVAILMESFERLPNVSKYVHLASLALIALTIILLMTPAAYHRIVERGEDTEHFHRFASKMVIASLVPLALGLCGDFYVVVEKVTESQLVSVVSTLVVLAVFWELWFGLTLYRRTQRDYAS